MTTFTIDDAQEKKLNDWLKTKDLHKYSGTIGGRFSYTFTPTSLGVIVQVSDSLEQKDTIDLSDYLEW